MFEQGATPRMATCSTHTRMEEEDATMQEEEDSSKDKAGTLQPMKTTPITGKTMQNQEECSKEEGASIPNQTNKTTPSNVDIVAKSATVKRSVERRRVSRLLQVSNSPIMPPTSNTMIMVNYS